jgi:hypothetical protein
MPYRFLRPDQQFHKYQWIEVKVVKASSDVRPESYHVDRDSIQIISETLPTTNAWEKRKETIDHLKGHCLCCIKKERDENGFPTLGIFKPKIIEELSVEPDDSDWTKEQREKLRQGGFFENAPTVELEKIPYKFRYVFRCEHAECSSHRAICTDWEMNESYRKWRRDYGEGWESKF